MLLLCWSAKGGSGTTVVSVGLALACSSARGRRALLVDLGGDATAALGLDDPPGPGVTDWARSAEADDHALHALAVEVTPGLAVLPCGSERTAQPDGGDGWQRLATALRSTGDVVVVDAGSGPPPAALAAAADHRLLVTRPCYLALRRAARCGLRPSGVVMVGEPGRALRADDVERAVDAPIAARVPSDPAIARAVDAGLLVARPPRTLVQPLAALVRGA